MTNRLSKKRQTAGTTLIELMIGIVLSTMLLAMTGSLWLYGSRSLKAMGNYAERNAKSHNALHLTSRDLYPATQASGFQNVRNTKWPGVTKAVVGKTTTCTWNATPPAPVRPETSQSDKAPLTVPVRSVQGVHGETAQTRGAP